MGILKRMWSWARPASWSLAAWVLAGIVASTVIGGGVFWLFVHWVGPLDGEDSARRGSQLFDAARTTVTLVGIIGLGGAAFLAYRKQKSNEDGHELEKMARDQAKTDQDLRARDHELRQGEQRIRESEQRRLTVTGLRDRYTSCAQQLGSESQPVRLAGVYGLAALADDWYEAENSAEAKVCIGLLCAYLRSGPDSAHLPKDEVDVRRSIVGVIRGRSISKSRSGRWEGPDFQLAGASLRAVDLSSAILNGAFLADVNLSGGMLIGVSLEGASLHGANLSLAHLDGANLIECHMAYCDLSHAYLRRAKMRGSDLHRADLSDSESNSASMDSANLIMAKLVNADLSNVVFRNARMAGADLTGAVLVGADLRETDLIAVKLRGVVWDSMTKWPDGFIPPPSAPVPDWLY